MMQPAVSLLLSSPPARLMRLHQPVGFFLLLWPCWWAVALASAGTPPPALLALTALGAFAMRAAGCVINDLTGRKLDALVERTRTRPLASGEMTVFQALIVLAALLALALAVALTLGREVLLWSMASLPLIVAYPWMKRITWWPQAFLGLTFNWGVIVGWVAAKGAPEAATLALYLAAFCWTLGYDTIYAFQDARDDAEAGIRSTALRLRLKAKRWLGVFYGGTVVFLALAGWLEGAGMLYYALLTLVLADFFCQIRRLDMNDPISCRTIFFHNFWVGGIIFLAVMVAGI